MKENINVYSVYYHYNPKNGKYYVGITMQEPERRWGYGGYHYKYNQHFWRAIQRDGWDNFEHVVIETGLSKEMAVSMEKILIKECDSYKHGYNQSYGGESMDGYEMAQEIKDKISEANKGEKSFWYGKKIPEDVVRRVAEKHINHPNCSKSVNQYDKEGNYITTFPSLNEVTRNFGVGVAKALHGEINTFHGFQWRFADDCNGKEPISKYIKHSKKFKPVIQYNLSGEKVTEYHSARELHDNGFNKNSISSVCNLKRMTYKGYIWRYLREQDIVGDKDSYYDLTGVISKINSDLTCSDKPLGQYDLQGHLINHFDSVVKAAKSVNGVSNNISLVCCGKKKSAYGFVWCYDENVDSLSKKLEFANKPLKKHKISRYTLDGEYLDTFNGAKPAVKELGFGIPSVIDACCFGMISDAFGYIWKYT